MQRTLTNDIPGLTNLFTETEEIKSVPYIWILNKLPSEATEDDYQYVPITSVLPNWTAIPTFSEMVKRLYDTAQINAELKEKFKDYFNNLQTIYDHFVLVDMGKFGKGLFARKDIPAGTKLLYSGHISSSHEITDINMNRFSLTEAKTISASTQIVLSGEKSLFVDGNDLPNYFQHLPELGNGDYNFTDDIKKN